MTSSAAFPFVVHGLPTRHRRAGRAHRLWVALVAGTLAAAGWCLGGPTLVLEPATYDWGRQPANKDRYAFQIVVRNRGDSRLQITRVRSTCSCTKAELTKTTLAPGETATLAGTLTTTGAEGEVLKHILLSSNDPDQPTAVAGLHIRFPLTGPGLRLRGATTVSRLAAGEARASVVVENCEERDTIRVLAVDVPGGWRCQTELPASVPPEGRAVLSLVCDAVRSADVPDTGSLGFVLVTDSPATPRVTGRLLYQPAPPPAGEAPEAGR